MYGDLGPRAGARAQSALAVSAFSNCHANSSEMRRPRLMMYNMYLEVVFSDDRQIEIGPIAWKLNV